MNNFIPILVVPAVPYGGGIRFLHRKTQIELDQEMAEQVWKLLGFANGYNDVSEIAELAKTPKDEAEEIFDELRDLELVVDVREQFMHFHKISNYPTAFDAGISQAEVEEYTRSKRLPVKAGKRYGFLKDEKSALYALRKKRRSCRSYSEQALTIEQIGGICHYGYSIKEHSVPSGGALYPLKIYVLVEKNQIGLDAGYYEYDAEADELVRFGDEVDEEQLKYCFNQEGMPFCSAVQIVIAADLMRQSYKYANRGYRLTMIEVGHVAENVCLYAAEQGLGTCEMGGVLDEALKAELELPENVWPMLVVAVGYPAGTETEMFNKIRYVEENVGEEHPVKEIWTKEFGEDGAFFGATTTYVDGNGKTQFAGATSTSYADAVFKATIEGRERWLSAQVRTDFYGPASALTEQWLDPRLIFPLTDEQAEKDGATVFSEDLPMSWTRGTKYDGSLVLVPSDIVYYGQKNEPNRIYFGHSSGIAAYTDYDEAKKRALTELIERDALMRNWYEHESPYVVGDNHLPVHVKKRMRHWAKKGRDLKILQMPSDYGFVFEAVIVSDEYPAFVSGAAATVQGGFIHDAIIKALQEAENNLLLVLLSPDRVEVRPEEVVSPTDHGRVYFDAANASKISWLWSGKARTDFVEPRYTDYEQLFSILETVAVDMSQENDSLKVVRVFSPKLVPINFGFNTAHYTHPALFGKVHPDSLKMPHYFA
ncbi:YcaO-like family protein [Candidatus Saccharibacteria bacterium]|nr:YcaO-like family protein [Candidatus Saccharibacteria bacterium]